MVYDEGFEFNLGKKDTKEFSSYFLFLKYSKNDKSNEKIKTKYASHCNEALLGWYHTDNGKWGCFYGHKLVKNYKKPTNGEASDKQIVVQNNIEPAAFIEKEIEVKEKTIENAKEFLMKKFNSQRFMQTNFENKTGNKFLTTATSTTTSTTNTNTKNKSLLSLNAGFTNHEEVVERINSMNLSWKAKVYSEFKGKTIEEMNKFYGRISKGQSETDLNSNSEKYNSSKMKFNNNENTKLSNYYFIFFFLFNFFI